MRKKITVVRKQQGGLSTSVAKPIVVEDPFMSNKDFFDKHHVGRKQLQANPIISELLQKFVDPKGYLPGIKDTDTESSFALPIQNRRRESAWNLYLGQPTNPEDLSPSEYQPGFSNEGSKGEYYKLSADHEQELLAAAGGKKWKKGPNGTMMTDVYDKGGIGGRMTLYKGKDGQGHYISYHDTWDLDPGGFPAEKIAGKPFEIYNRIYLNKPKQQGGPLVVHSKKDPRYRAYQDSLTAYQVGQENLNLVNKYGVKDFEKIPNPGFHYGYLPSGRKLEADNAFRVLSKVTSYGVGGEDHFDHAFQNDIEQHNQKTGKRIDDEGIYVGNYPASWKRKNVSGHNPIVSFDTYKKPTRPVIYQAPQPPKSFVQTDYHGQVVDQQPTSFGASNTMAIQEPMYNTSPQPKQISQGNYELNADYIRRLHQQQQGGPSSQAIIEQGELGKDMQGNLIQVDPNAPSHDDPYLAHAGGIQKVAPGKGGVMADNLHSVLSDSQTQINRGDRKDNPKDAVIKLKAKEAKLIAKQIGLDIDPATAISPSKFMALLSESRDKLAARYAGSDKNRIGVGKPYMTSQHINAVQLAHLPTDEALYDLAFNIQESKKQAHPDFENLPDQHGKQYAQQGFYNPSYSSTPVSESPRPRTVQLKTKRSQVTDFMKPELEAGQQWAIDWVNKRPLMQKYGEVEGQNIKPFTLSRKPPYQADGIVPGGWYKPDTKEIEAFTDSFEGADVDVADMQGYTRSLGVHETSHALDFNTVPRKAQNDYPYRQPGSLEMLGHIASGVPKAFALMAKDAFTGSNDASTWDAQRTKDFHAQRQAAQRLEDGYVPKSTINPMQQSLKLIADTPKKTKSEYFNDPTEIHARLMQWRHMTDTKPTEVITPQMYYQRKRKAINKMTPGGQQGADELYNTLEDRHIINLLNSTVQNQQTQTPDAYYSQQGGSVRDKLIRDKWIPDVKASYWGDEDSTATNVAEIFDPTGITSWDDLYRSYRDTGWSGATGLEALGALPVLGKVGKGIKLLKGMSKIERAEKVANPILRNLDKLDYITPAAASVSKVTGAVLDKLPTTWNYLINPTTRFVNGANTTTDLYGAAKRQQGGSDLGALAKYL